MSLSSLYAKLESCQNQLKAEKIELQDLKDELEICKENKVKYENQKKDFLDIVQGERTRVNHLYNLSNKNKLSKRLHEVMNDKFNGRECSRTIESSQTISIIINEVISELIDKIDKKILKIQSLNERIDSIKAEIREEKERERNKQRGV